MEANTAGSVGEAIVNYGNLNVTSIFNPTIPETTKHIQGEITIGGIKFSRNDLVHIFFNTPLEQLAEFEGDANLPVWMDRASLLLIKGFIDGEVMPLVLYKYLSREAFNNLSYEGSLLYLMDYAPFKFQINMAYKKGVKFREYAGGELLIVKSIFNNEQKDRVNKILELIAEEGQI